MLFLARELHFSNGESLRNMVVDVMGGVVNDFYPFGGEVHSMSLVDELFLSSFATLKYIADIKKISRPKKGERLYAYVLDKAGELVLVG